MRRRADLLPVVIAYLGFVVLGLPDGMLGVAWPSMWDTFDIPLDAVGVLLITGTAGSLLAGLNSGRLISRIGVGKFLLIGCLLRGAGLLGYGLSPAWWVIVLLGFAVGFGSGSLDTGLNTYFATNHKGSLMNWLHASFGLGATLGPILMTAMLDRGQSWRWGYVVVGLAQGLFVLLFGLTLERWRLGEGEPSASEADPPGEAVSGLGLVRLPVVWLGMLFFFCYAGNENTAGQWAYSLFTEARAVTPAVAGAWVSTYWGCLTVGRVLFGFVADRLRADRLLRVVMIGVIGGTVLLWWNASNLLSFLGLALMGFAQAPIFPLAVLTTPRRVGAERAPTVIGFQMAAAGAGFALLPALAGVLARNASLELVAPFLVLASVGVFLLHEGMVRSSRRV